MLIGHFIVWILSFDSLSELIILFDLNVLAKQNLSLYQYSSPPIMRPLHMV